MNEKSRERVVIKIIKMIKEGVNADQLKKESDLLKECQSKYIVRYYDVVTNEKEYWV